MRCIATSKHLPLAVDNPEWREVHVIDPAGGSALGLGHEVAHLPVRPRHRLLPPVPAAHHLLLLALKIEINLRASMFGKRMPFILIANLPVYQDLLSGQPSSSLPSAPG